MSKTPKVKKIKAWAVIWKKSSAKIFDVPDNEMFISEEIDISWNRRFSKKSNFLSVDYVACKKKSDAQKLCTEDFKIIPVEIKILTEIKQKQKEYLKQ